VTFSSPSWRSLNPLKGSLNHPKKVTLNHQVGEIFFHLARYIIGFFSSWSWSYDRMSRATPFSNLSSERSGLSVDPFFFKVRVSENRRRWRNVCFARLSTGTPNKFSGCPTCDFCAWSREHRFWYLEITISRAESLSAPDNLLGDMDLSPKRYS